ncbi:MAG: hypothetical protein Kow00124_31480 [Anaerolineae bacterium]
MSIVHRAHPSRTLPVLLALTLAALACNLPLAGGAAGEPTPPAETPQATLPLEPTAAGSATATPTSQAAQPTPTITRVPTRTPAPTLDPDCPPDATFIEDVTVPDGTRFEPGETFNKTWRVVSDGCADWPAGTALYFVRGDRMDGPQRAEVPPVPTGEEVDLTIRLTAPTANGSYRGYWELRGPDGVRFGPNLYADIRVGEGTTGGGTTGGALPDLTVESYTYEVTATASGDRSMSIQAVIKNIGAGDAPASKAGVSLVDAGAGAEVDVPALAAGASYTLSFGFTVDPGRTYTLRIEADVIKAIAESNENNNVQQQDIPVSGG